MKKLKLFLGFIVLIFASLVIYQNREYFFAEQALSLSLGIDTWHWTTPLIQNIVYYCVFLILGLLVAGFFGIVSKFKSRKTIKSLNKTIDSHLEKIASLKGDLETFTSDPYSKTEEKDETGSGDAETAEKDATT